MPSNVLGFIIIHPIIWRWLLEMNSPRLGALIDIRLPIFLVARRPIEFIRFGGGKGYEDSIIKWRWELNYTAHSTPSSVDAPRYMRTCLLFVAILYWKNWSGLSCTYLTTYPWVIVYLPNYLSVHHMILFLAWSTNLWKTFNQLVE